MKKLFFFLSLTFCLSTQANEAYKLYAVDPLTLQTCEGWKAKYYDSHTNPYNKSLFAFEYNFHCRELPNFQWLPS